MLINGPLQISHKEISIYLSFRFVINLVEHDDDGKLKNVILHVNPRFDEQKWVVVRNTNIMGHWGPEEREGDFPLEPGKNFEAVIVVHDDCFKVKYFML